MLKLSDLKDGEQYWVCSKGIVKPGKNMFNHIKPAKFIFHKATNNSSWGSYNKGVFLSKKGVPTNKKFIPDEYHELFEDELDCLERYSEINKEIIVVYDNWWEQKKIWYENKREEFKKFIRE